MIKDDKKFKYEAADKMWLPRYVCEAVSRRASMMASAGVTALLKKMDYKVRIGGLGRGKDFSYKTKHLLRTWWSPSMGLFSDSTLISRMWCSQESLKWWGSTSSLTFSFRRWADAFIISKRCQKINLFAIHHRIVFFLLTIFIFFMQL